MPAIDWSSISPEQFQTLCVTLLFREGYRNIVPLGSRGVKEEGRDAIEETMFANDKQMHVIVFQFKRWTADYSDRDIQRLLAKELDEKILPSERQIDEYRLITCHPLATIKDWIVDELSAKYPFPVRYFDNSWLENRLVTDSQDLRREYFGIGIERHSWESLVATCGKQVKSTVSILGSRYIREIYVERNIEKDFEAFLKSDKSCFVIVDRSGRGKTNMLCHIAETFSEVMPVVFILGARQLSLEHDLAVQITVELGYASPEGTRWQMGIEDMERVVRQAHAQCLILIDGVSENNDIVVMKKALRELLLRYGDSQVIKFCVTCRDTLWPRFVTEFPEQYIYSSSTLANARGEPTTSFDFGVYLGDWKETEYQDALRKYCDRFNIEFTLEGSAALKCRYPLILRLFCEAYEGRTLGSIEYLPSFQVFKDYVDTKVQKIIDYFGLDIPLEKILLCLQQIRYQMWNEQDRSDLPQARVERLIADAGVRSINAVLERMLDEGLLLRLTDSAQEQLIRFSFDELSDYLLYLRFVSNEPPDRRSAKDIIVHMCSLYSSGSPNEVTLAGRFLVLLAHNVDDSETLSFLWARVIQVDLELFARCVWQRMVFDDLPQSEISKLEVFCMRLTQIYKRTIELYFPELRPQFDPYSTAKGDELGIDITVSPGMREVSYQYTLRTEGQKQVVAKTTDRFPIWELSLSSDDGKVLKLHDPGRGMIISLFRGGPHTALRTLDFEWNSPFSGVSLLVPDRIALHDIWNEVTNIIDKHLVFEVPPLIRERALYLLSKLPHEFAESHALDTLRSRAKNLLNSLPQGSVARSELRQNVDELCSCVEVVGSDAFERWLPEPDLPATGDLASADIWRRYSDDKLRQYLLTVASAFVSSYLALVEHAFPHVLQRFSLYQQWPFSIMMVVSGTRDFIRLAASPEETESDASVKLHFLPPDMNFDIAVSQFAVNGKPLEVFVEESLHSRKQMVTVDPVDLLLPMRELFVAMPLRGLVCNWLKTDIASLLQVSFHWPTI